MAVDSDILAIGDSVMLGARTRMLRTLPGITVDAEVGRQPRQSVTLVQRYLEQKPDLKHAVVHLGTNGYILKSDLRRLLDFAARCSTGRAHQQLCRPSLE
jgi:hypothetical protein